MKRYMRKVIGRTPDNRAELYCGHQGDFTQLTELGNFQFCPTCKMKQSNPWPPNPRPWVYTAERAAQRKAWHDKNRAKRNAYKEPDPLKRWARMTLASAVKRGRIVRQPCEACGEVSTDAHHDDYSKPLMVRWLCRPCHMAHHKKLREQQIAS